MQWAPVAFLVFAAGSLIGSTALAATPREELLRLVPDDVAFCVVLQDLRGHAARFQKSPFLEQFQKSALPKPLEDSKDLKKLLFLDNLLEKNLGISPHKLLEELFAHAQRFPY